MGAVRASCACPAKKEEIKSLTYNMLNGIES